MSVRNDYEELFVRHGISRKEVCAMTEAEFQQTLDHFLNERNPVREDNSVITSQYRYISPKMAQFYAAQQQDWEDEEEALQRAIQDSLLETSATPGQQSVRSEASQVREEQDHEYKAACEDAEQQTFESRNQDIFVANEAAIAQEQQEERDGAVIGRYYSLPAEPATGTTIAAVVNGERCIRKFDPDRPAADVYSWVAGQTIHSDEGKLYFDEFELAMAGKGPVDPERTLKDQGMTGRVMLQVVPV
jgi:hypothetical protein